MHHSLSLSEDSGGGWPQTLSQQLPIPGLLAAGAGKPAAKFSLLQVGRRGRGTEAASPGLSRSF